jgi:hypothetical protein
MRPWAASLRKVPLFSQSGPSPPGMLTGSVDTLLASADIRLTVMRPTEHSILVAGSQESLVATVVPDKSGDIRERQVDRRSVVRHF